MNEIKILGEAVNRDPEATNNSNPKYQKYGQSENGNFWIHESIGVPHSYTVTPKHINYCADNCQSSISDYSLQECDNNGIKCGYPQCNLSFKEHEQALIVACKIDPKKAENEIKDYLSKINETVEKDGFVGYSFMDAETIGK